MLEESARETVRPYGQNDLITGTWFVILAVLANNKCLRSSSVSPKV
jgi:hypothetical protein